MFTKVSACSVSPQILPQSVLLPCFWSPLQHKFNCNPYKCILLLPCPSVTCCHPLLPTSASLLAVLLQILSFLPALHNTLNTQGHVASCHAWCHSWCLAVVQKWSLTFFSSFENSTFLTLLNSSSSNPAEAYPSHLLHSTFALSVPSSQNGLHSWLELVFSCQASV